MRVTTSPHDLHIVSVSGGKDSTALYCWAIDQFGKDGFLAVFSDTQHEHPVTYNYLRNLPQMAGGPPIHWVRSDFSEKVRQKGLEPSGNAYLDLMLWKGRTPGVKSQFCTEKLKLEPVKTWMDEVRGDREVFNYIGVRAQESERRSKMPERNFAEFYDAWVVRPLLRWTTDEVFALLESKGVPPNPLYALGYGRVGCFPCIHANKTELSLLPDWAWDKLADWEGRVGRSWFAYGTVPLAARQKYELGQIAAKHGFTLDELKGIKKKAGQPAGVVALLAEVKAWKDANSPSVEDVRRWCKTSRGGVQEQLFPPDQKDVPSCMSTWGVCE